METERSGPRPAAERSGPRPATAVGLVALVAGAAVLRFAHIGGTTLIWDETYTGAAARLAPLDVIRFLRDTDVHPPLDYLLRVPFATGTSEWLLRLPSVLASLLATAATARWLRKSGTLGIVATAAMALGSFQLTYAWQARPYAPMVLTGVCMAWLAYRWLGDESPRLAVVAGVVMLVGCLTSESGLFVAAGLALLPGLRRDRNAWWWRGAMVGAVVVWVGLWAPLMLHQLRNVAVVAPVPYTTVHRFFSTVNELVDSVPAIAVLVVLAVAGGGWVLRQIDRHLARVWLCGFAFPVVATAVVGIRVHLFWPKTLAVVSWGPAVALGALVVTAARRWRLLGLVATVAVALLVVPSTVHTMQHPQPRPPEWAASIHQLARVVRPGDAVVSDSTLDWPADWYVGHDPYDVSKVTGLDGHVFVRGGGRWTGRLWAFEPRNRPIPTPGFVRCRPPMRTPSYEVRCLTRGKPAPAPG